MRPGPNLTQPFKNKCNKYLIFWSKFQRNNHQHKWAMTFHFRRCPDLKLPSHVRKLWNIEISCIVCLCVILVTYARWGHLTLEWLHMHLITRQTIQNAFAQTIYTSRRINHSAQNVRTMKTMRDRCISQLFSKLGTVLRMRESNMHML